MTPRLLEAETIIPADKGDGKILVARKNPAGEVVAITLRGGTVSPVSARRAAGPPSKNSRCIRLADFGKYDKLESLSLAGCGAVDMEGLAELKHLKTLDLSGARIRNFGYARSDSLEKLALNHSVPEDGGFFFGGELKNLRELSLNGLADEIRVEGVNGLALRRLYLRGCSKKDLGFLRGCRIDELYMEGSSAARVVVDLKYLENLPLQILHLGRLVRVRNTKYLQTLSQLRDLDISLSGNKDFSFATLRGLPLKRLKLWHHTIVFPREEAVLLSQLPLNELHLFEIIFDDIRPVLAMPLHTLGLRQLALPADTLKILAQNPSLHELTLAHPLLPDGKVFVDFPWQDLASLRVSELDLSRASIGGDWSWIWGMSNLEVLILPRSIRDLEPLTGMRFRLLVAPGLSPTEKSRQMLKYRIEEIL